LIISHLAVAGIWSNCLETSSHGLVATKTPWVDELGATDGATDKSNVGNNKASPINMGVLFISFLPSKQVAGTMVLSFI
jgi:hypothetical protein